METKSFQSVLHQTDKIIDELLNRQYRSINILLFSLSENSDQNNINDVKTNSILSEMGVNIKPVSFGYWYLFI